MQGTSPQTGASPAPHQASPDAAALATLETVRHALAGTHDAILTLSAQTEQFHRERDGAREHLAQLQRELETLRTAYQQGQAQQNALQHENARLEQLHRETVDQLTRANAQVAQAGRETLGVKSDLDLAVNQLQTVRAQMQAARVEAQGAHQELHGAKTQLERAKEHNRALHGEILSLYHDLRADDLPSLILQLALRLTGAEAGLFTEADGDGTLADFGLDSLPPEVTEGLYGFSRQVAQQQEPFIENDAKKLPDGSGCVNIAVLPVTAKGTARGVLLLANKRSGGFDEEDTRLLLAIGEHAGLALENARLHGQLTEAYAATVAVLADAIEAKDAYTRGHCEGVSRVAVEVGRRLGLESDKLDEVRYAALLHDVGKIGVPDGILLKPGRLMPEEFAIIQKHSRIGRDLVSRVPALAHLGDIVLHHHERWDGAGYPDGLAGEGIPLVSRVICAVDAFDAMTTSRPYREAVAIDEAIAEMKRCSGSQFDPEIIALMAQVLTEMPYLPQSPKPTESALGVSLAEELHGTPDKAENAGMQSEKSASSDA